MILVTFHGVDPTIKSYGELLIWLGGVKFAKLVELVLGLFLVGVTGGERAKRASLLEDENTRDDERDEIATDIMATSTTSLS